MSIVVVAHLYAREGREDEVLATLRQLTADTVPEDGCESYVLHRSIDDPCDFTFVESWASVDALAAHDRQPHLAKAFERADELFARAPDVRRYEALGAA
jgi:quinol monooxygenase YgiN